MSSIKCSVPSCQNGTRGLQKWMEEHCSIHDCNKGTTRCKCKPPYKLIKFPTEKKDPERRAEWIKLMNRKNVKTGKDWVPGSNSRVCSRHFVNGAPSSKFPNPSLNLGDPLKEARSQQASITFVRIKANKAYQLKPSINKEEVHQLWLNNIDRKNLVPNHNSKVHFPDGMPSKAHSSSVLHMGYEDHGAVSSVHAPAKKRFLQPPTVNATEVNSYVTAEIEVEIWINKQWLVQHKLTIFSVSQWLK